MGQGKPIRKGNGLVTPPQRLIPRREIPGEVRRLTGEAKNPHEQTIRRWYTRGVKGVVLRVRYIGGEVFTTRGWLEEFFDLVTVASQRTKRVRPSDFLPSRQGMAAQQRLLKRLAK